MPLATTDLVDEAHYFISQKSAVLWSEKTGDEALNHLLLGDWLEYRGETHVHNWTSRGKPKSETYALVRCRGNTGWLRLRDFDADRGLEVNFVDIGQGDGCHIVTPKDEVMLIDAGVSDNMERFLSWRYNLRNRNVRRAEGFDPAREAKDPFEIDHVILSHPDKDHYYGFLKVFQNPKFSVKEVTHNGIIERPPVESDVAGVTTPYDLGGQFISDGQKYLYDYVSSTSAVKKIIKDAGRSGKDLMDTLRALFKTSPDVRMNAVGANMASLDRPVFLEGFEEDKAFSLQILGPIRERVTLNGKRRTALRRLGVEGVTKNGHSVILKARFHGLTLLLGGDLNAPAQNFLLQAYAGTQQTPEATQKAIAKLEAKKTPLKEADQERLDDLRADLDLQAETGRAVFQSDVAKACHHGSQHIIDAFVRAVDATATVISSGDNESHSHPRPDALGAYGKLGRGARPLIFSTELARSTDEFTSQISNYTMLRGITLQIEAETDAKKKAKLLKTLEGKRDRNVAVYGMITLRAKGGKVIIAQKLEKVTRQDRKWDIYELEHDADLGQYNYHGH